MTKMLGHVLRGTASARGEWPVVVGQLCLIPAGLGVAQEVEGGNPEVSTVSVVSGAIVCAISPAGSAPASAALPVGAHQGR